MHLISFITLTRSTIKKCDVAEFSYERFVALANDIGGGSDVFNFRLQIAEDSNVRFVEKHACDTFENFIELTTNRTSE